MSQEPKGRPEGDRYPSDVEILQVSGREFILVGTAHISQ